MTTAAPTIDILDRAFWQRNPHDAWTWCRANDPVHRDERSGIWCITKHADVQWRRAPRRAVLVGLGVPAQRVAGRVEHDRQRRPGAPPPAAARQPAVHAAGGEGADRRCWPR